MRRIDIIVLHHSGGTPTASKLDITGEQRFKVIKKEQHAHAVVAGWGENYVMDYHFVIGQTGKVFTGQPIENPSWHATNYQVNLASIGICLLGDFEKTIPPKAQENATTRLIVELVNKYGIAIENIKRHKDIVSDITHKANSTDCPGKFFPFSTMIKKVFNMALKEDNEVKLAWNWAIRLNLMAKPDNMSEEEYKNMPMTTMRFIVMAYRLSKARGL